MAEYNVFSKLIEKHGVPRIVIPNTPSCLYTRANSGSYYAGETPPVGLDPLSARVVYCRVPLGHEPFLQIHRYVQIEARAVNSARPALLEMGVVEVLRGGSVRGPRGGTKQVARIAVREDVSPLGAEEFAKALAQRRVLAIHAERSMGDSFVTFEVVKDAARGGGGFCFLFDAPCRLTDTELSFSSSEGSWDGAGAVLDNFRQHFTRPLVRQQ